MVVVMSSFGAKTFIWPHQDLHCMVVIEEMKGEIPSNECCQNSSHSLGILPFPE